METTSTKKYVAEALGTGVLTLFGCGAAAATGGVEGVLGVLGIAFAFGFAIVAMAFAIGNISGCHINPAVSLGFFLDKRLSGKDLIGYWISQFIGGIAGAAILLGIIMMSDADVALTGLGTNGFGEASYVGVSMIGAVLVEIILTFVFVLTILGVTADTKTAPYAGLIIGLTLVFVHIFGIVLTGTSVNPARSFGPALMMATQGDMLALTQVWVFIVAPLVGAAVAAGLFAWLKPKNA